LFVSLARVIERYDIIGLWNIEFEKTLLSLTSKSGTQTGSNGKIRPNLTQA
jgi:hypothetical protein